VAAIATVMLKCCIIITGSYRRGERVVMYSIKIPVVGNNGEWQCELFSGDGRDSKQSEHSSIMHIAQQLDSSLKMAKIQDLEAYWVILLRKLVLFQLKGPRFKNNDFKLFPFIKSDKC